MRNRSKLLSTLEAAYRAEFERAEQASDEDRMARLDFEFQRDQVFMELLVDLRDVVVQLREPDEPAKKSLLEKAGDLKKLTRFR